MIRNIVLLGMIPFCVYSQNSSFHSEFSGQLISWTHFNFSSDFTNQWGGRYIPELSLDYRWNKKWNMDFEGSVNTYGTGTWSENNLEWDGQLKPYRLWVRLNSDRFFLRTGLQKISFGSASMLRPLMWFDQLDPRDPLQLTDGVYGILARYSFLNNANLWFWSLYGNDKPRGWDTFATRDKSLEYGGRFQHPVATGEAALSFHHRKLENYYINTLSGAGNFRKNVSQNKFGLDGKWDIGIGIWVENSLERNSDGRWKQWNNLLALGADYTFGVGNGLNLTLENLLWYSGDNLIADRESYTFTALMANYPLGLFDQLSSIIYYSHTDGKLYNFFNWTRQFDFLVFHIMAYWNPQFAQIMSFSDATQLYSGKGFQFMIVFNY